MLSYWTVTLLCLAGCKHVLAQLSPPKGDPSINTSVYNNILRFTKYSAAAYASTCPQPPNNSTVVQYFNDQTTDTQATLFRDDTRGEVVIAFRGTSDLQDFSTDFAQALVPLNSIYTNDCQGCKVHNGTLYAWNSVSDSIISAIRSELGKYPGYKLIVTGHSLGGALASISSTSLVHIFPNLTMYSFGQFRTGNPAYATYVDSLLPYPRFHRVTHTFDGVPQTIHKDAGYLHHSREYWQLEPFGPSNTYRCQPGDDDECNQSTLGLGLGGKGTVEGINTAHLCYSGILIGNPLDRGASACNAVSLFPQNCSGLLEGIL